MKSWWVLALAVLMTGCATEPESVDPKGEGETTERPEVDPNVQPPSAADEPSMMYRYTVDESGEQTESKLTTVEKSGVMDWGIELHPEERYRGEGVALYLDSSSGTYVERFTYTPRASADNTRDHFLSVLADSSSEDQEGGYLVTGTGPEGDSFAVDAGDDQVVIVKTPKA